MNTIIKGLFVIAFLAFAGLSINSIVNLYSDTDNQEITNNIQLSPKKFEPFCGISTNGYCESDSDCIRGGCSGQVCESVYDESAITICDDKECYNAAVYSLGCGCIDNQCSWN